MTGGASGDAAVDTGFRHLQSAHCESGVSRNLLVHAGVSQMTEPLAFGIGSGLFFVYIPFMKINNGPVIAFRTWPGQVFRQTCHSLGIPVTRKKFRSRGEAQKFLDEQLDKGNPVGCQVGVYYLPYFPKEYRFHFNAHNLVVFGKEGDKYLVSDPVMENVTGLTTYELERVRFAHGALAPHGQAYFPGKAPHVTDEMIREAIRNGIRKNINNMLHIPGPIAGVSGIRFTGRRIRKWLGRLGPEKAGLYLAQLVRMQEEIGTGGGGFRFMYAAFLQEAFAYQQDDILPKTSDLFTTVGDAWRDAAIQASGIYKGRLGSQADYNDMGDRLLRIADQEETAFRELRKIRWQ